MSRFQRVAQVVAAVALVLIALVLVQVRSQVDTASRADVERAEQVSQENQQILDRVEGGIGAIEAGYACLVAVLFVQPEDRVGIDPLRFEQVCGVNLAQLQLLTAALEAANP